jgi:hypothetical protein
MQRLVWAALVLAAGTLTACGSSDNGDGQRQDDRQEKAAASSGPKPNATAAEVAKEARGKIRCPAKVSTPEPAGLPVHDVVGVRPGMTYDEAANVVLCTHELLVVTENNRRGFKIQTYGQTLRQGFDARFAQPRVQKTSEQIMKEMQADFMTRGNNAVRQDMSPGQAKWYVGTMGMPGQEKVFSVAREEWFEESRNPTKESIEQALIKKYGTPMLTLDSDPYRMIWWSYDPFGRAITETSPLYNRCQGHADPDAGANLTPDCGIAVAATIMALRDNPALAQYFQVSVVDMAGGYELLTATEQALQQMENQRRAKEVEEASKNAAGPTL